MFHYVYRIDNLLNNKFYIGVRTSKILPEKDNYFGSGKIIKDAIRKYKKQNFKKTILNIFETRALANAKEKELVNGELVNNPLCYNLVLGGSGEWTRKSILAKRVVAPMPIEIREKISKSQLGVPKPKHSEEANLKKRERQKGKPNLWMSTDAGKDASKRASQTVKESYASGSRVHHYQGKHRSEADRTKISESLAGRSPPNKGKPMSAEQKRKISEHQLGKHDRISLELKKINWTYEQFKQWVTGLHHQGLGPIRILHKVPVGCSMSETPIKKILKDLKNA